MLVMTHDQHADNMAFVESKQVMAFIGFSEFLGLQGGFATTFCYQSTPLLNLYVLLLQPVVSLGQMLLQIGFHYLIHAVRVKSFRGFRATPYIRATRTLFITFYFGLIMNCIRALHCVDFKGESHLKFQPSINCSDPHYLGLRYIAIGVLVVTVLLQFSFFFIVKRAASKGLLDPKTVNKVVIWSELYDLMTEERQKLQNESVIQQSTHLSVQKLFKKGTRKASKRQHAYRVESGKPEAYANDELEPREDCIQDFIPPQEEKIKEELEEIRISRDFSGMAKSWSPAGLPHFNQTLALYHSYGSMLVKIV